MAKCSKGVLIIEVQNCKPHINDHNFLVDFLFDDDEFIFYAFFNALLAQYYNVVDYKS